MNNKFFLLIFAVFLIGNVFALTQIGEYEGSFDVNSGEAGIIFEVPNVICIEDWTCSYWSGCTNNNKVFNCRDCNHCGTYYLLPQNCGITESCQQSNGGNNNNNGGNSGGGATTYSSSSSGKCIEQWNCSEWSECTNGNQTRTCKDKKNCKTTLLKPVEKQICTSTSAQDTRQGLRGITGAVIGALGTKGAIGVTIFIIAIIVIAILVNMFNKKKKASKSK